MIILIPNLLSDLSIDCLDCYNTALSILDNASHIMNNITIPRPNFANNMSPYAIDLYERSLTIASTNTVNVREFIHSYTYSFNFSSFSPLGFKNSLVGFHTQIAMNIMLHKIVMGISGVICIVAGVFFNANIKNHGSRYDPVREAANSSVNNETNNSHSYTNKSSIQLGTNDSGGTNSSGGSEGNGDKNNKKPGNNSFLDSPKPVVNRNTLIAILYIRGRIINWRTNNPHAEGPESDWYGTPVRTDTRHGTRNINQLVSLAQITRYAIVNSQEIVPALNTPLRAILSDSAIEAMTLSASFRTLFNGILTGRHLQRALRDYEAIKNLLGHKFIEIDKLNDFINKYS